MFKYVCVVCGKGLADERMRETCSDACLGVYLKDPDKFCRYDHKNRSRYLWGEVIRSGRSPGWLRREIWQRVHGRHLASNKCVWITCGNLECINDRHFVLKELDEAMMLRRRIEAKRLHGERARNAGEY